MPQQSLQRKTMLWFPAPGDLWQAIRVGGEPWIVDDALYIDPIREAYLDYAKTLYDNGYSNDTTAWTDAWYADMDGLGAKPVFAFLGPAWLINYVMADHSDNTFGEWGRYHRAGWLLLGRHLAARQQRFRREGSRWPDHRVGYP